VLVELMVFPQGQLIVGERLTVTVPLLESAGEYSSSITYVGVIVRVAVRGGGMHVAFRSNRPRMVSERRRVPGREAMAHSLHGQVM
jgi:hypothetical protein